MVHSEPNALHHGLVALQKRKCPALSQEAQVARDGQLFPLRIERFQIIMDQISPIIPFRIILKQ